MAPSFDYHAELELSPGASKQEITASYRRLALLHHPDKNPDNHSAATAKFQRIGEAYDGLINPSTRAQPQAAPRAQPQHQSRQYQQYYEESDDDDDEYGYYEFEEDYYGFNEWNNFFAGAGFGPRRRETYQNYDDMEREFQEWERRDWERHLAYLARARHERERREAAAAKKAAERKAQKEAAEAASQQLRVDSQKLEQAKQEERWEANGCLTKDEKVQACLHSNYCAKVKQQKKTKCSTSRCGRRVLIAFDCPYCHSLLCQQCVNDFAQRRTKLENVKPSGESTSEPDGNDDPASEPEQPLEDEHADPEAEDEHANTIPRSGHDTTADPDNNSGQTGHENVHQDSNDKPGKGAKRAKAGSREKEVPAKPSVVVDETVESDEQLAERLQQEWNEQVAREELASREAARSKAQSNHETPLPEQSVSPDGTTNSKKKKKQKKPKEKQKKATNPEEPKETARATAEAIPDREETKSQHNGPTSGFFRFGETNSKKEFTHDVRTTSRADTNSDQNPPAVDQAIFSAPIVEPPTGKISDEDKDHLRDELRKAHQRIAELEAENKKTDIEPSQSSTSRTSTVGSTSTPEAATEREVNGAGATDSKPASGNAGKCSRCKRSGHDQSKCWIAHPELKKADKRTPNATATPPADAPANAPQKEPTKKAKCASCKKAGHDESRCWVAHPELKKAAKNKPKSPPETPTTPQPAAPKKTKCAFCKKGGHEESVCRIAHPELKKETKSTSNPPAETPTTAQPVSSQAPAGAQPVPSQASASAQPAPPKKARCPVCNKPGHQEPECLIAHPELFRAKVRVKCTRCRVKGHKESECWIAHPELKPAGVH